jgi:hypothetical protein
MCMLWVTLKLISVYAGYFTYIGVNEVTFMLDPELLLVYGMVDVDGYWHAREEALSTGYIGENCEVETNVTTYCRFAKTVLVVESSKTYIALMVTQSLNFCSCRSWHPLQESTQSTIIETDLHRLSCREQYRILTLVLSFWV